MPTRRASRELLASVEDVWEFVAEPYHLADWWPNLATVNPDRRGFAVGARWTVRTQESTWFRQAHAEDVLVVQAVDPERRFAFQLVRAKLGADLALEHAGPERTSAELAVAGPLFPGFPRTLPDEALARLHDLVQTAADF